MLTPVGKSGQDIAQDLLTNPTLQVFHSSNKYMSLYLKFLTPTSIGSRNRILNITKEEDGTFTVYFQKGTKGEDRAQPVKNVGGIIWCWGFQWIELPVDGTYNVGTFYNDVLYKNYPGVTRVGTQGVLASSVCACSLASFDVFTESSSSVCRQSTHWSHSGSQHNHARVDDGI